MRRNPHGPILALDIGGTKTMVGVVDSSGRILMKRYFPTVPQDTPDQHLRKCAAQADGCLSDLDLNRSSIQGIGVSVPGMADPGRGVLLYAPFLGWRNVDVRTMLARDFPLLPVEIDNDVNACALAEVMFGAANAYRNLLWVTVSTGIGAGIVAEGAVYRGETFIAGELGHVVVEWERGQPCNCGRRGCLEAHASGTAIGRIARDKVEQEGPGSAFALFFKERGTHPDAKGVAAAAHAGMDTGLEIYRQAGMYLGRALSYAVNLLDPGCIVLGGGVSLSFALMEPGIREEMRRSVIRDTCVPIMQSRLGYDAALIGAAGLILRHNFSQGE